MKRVKVWRSEDGKLWRDCEEVTAYEGPDGEIYATYEECLTETIKVNLDNWYKCLPDKEQRHVANGFSNGIPLTRWLALQRTDLLLLLQGEVVCPHQHETY